MKTKINELALKLRYQFKNASLLETAMTHKSAIPSDVSDNEKLEFIGDAVLDLVVSEILFLMFPHDNEGVLSKKRASLVNEEVLNTLALKLELNVYLILGKGEKLTGGQNKPRLLASAFEALLGAIFMDSGYNAVKSFLHPLMLSEIENLNLEIHFVKDYKTRLQEVTSKKFKLSPIYKLVEEEGPAHEKKFKVNLIIGDQISTFGDGKTKKEAEQRAAEKALKEIV